MKFIKQLIGLGYLVVILTSCGKGFLDIKQNKGQVVPTTIADFQGIIDNWTKMNMGSSHELSVIGADEFIVSDVHWNLLSQPYQKNAFIWAEDVYEGQEVGDWNRAYNRILMANIALDGVKKLIPSNNEIEAWNNVKGSALFFRAWNHYQLAQLFCKTYDPRSAFTDLGIPLRLESDITIKASRASVEGTYNQIIEDLLKASDLLPIVSINKMRPSKPAAYALLARVYLMVGNYQKAGEYANLCLELKDDLIDFNTLNLDSEQLFPFDLGETNPEMIFFCFMNDIQILIANQYNIDTNLFQMYEKDDLRKKGYFYEVTGTNNFKGSYVGGNTLFTGLATDEVYLIRAECAARAGNYQLAMRDVNLLLKHRWNKVSFQPISDLKSDEILYMILQERRKELVLRGIRWEDLRRLNLDDRYSQILLRVVDGKSYELKPNSKRYVWHFPDTEVDLGNLIQNDR